MKIYTHANWYETISDWFARISNAAARPARSEPFNLAKRAIPAAHGQTNSKLRIIAKQICDAQAIDEALPTRASLSYTRPARHKGELCCGSLDLFGVIIVCARPSCSCINSWPTSGRLHSRLAGPVGPAAGSIFHTA